MKEKQIGDSCKCNDCGKDFIYTADMINRRGDICSRCWDNRGWALKNRELIGTAEFTAIQKAMSNGNGTAYKRIHSIRQLGCLK